MDYEFLSADSVAQYIASRPDLRDRIDASRITSVAEVGDGNLNLVFIVGDADGRSMVLKQALPYVRLVGPDWPMTPDRAAKEATSLRQHRLLAPDLVPEIFDFDSDRYIIAMEDLSDHVVWRTALIEGRRHDGAAARMGEYVASVAFGTSVLGLDAEEQKERLAASVNPDLCLITEDLVFTEPYADNGRNSVLPANEADARALAEDTYMVTQMGLAKWKFMTEAQALIHGDLHTGSVMVRAQSGDEGPVSSAKAFDSEFAFYGPVAFDLGALWANYALAAARAVALGDDDLAQWTLDLTGQTWTSFEARIRELWPSRVDPRVFSDGMLEGLLSDWRRDTWLFAAAKMARRIVGLAKVKDVESLDPSLREGAARGALAVARRAVRDRYVDSSPEAFIAMAREELLAATTR